jgi:predicted unusual protein kinase regulating ubiquinone biosynthesis (AarF/ABC1/UbiB family)
MFFDYLEIFYTYILYKFSLLDYSSTVKKIVLKLSTMSILFVKMFQWFSYDFTNNLCDRNKMDNLFNNFLNKVNYKEEEIDREELNKLIRKFRQDNKTLVIEDLPCNSGTIGLAFKGKLDEKKIIIKLLRKDISNKIIKDINNIDFFFYILNLLKFENIKEISNFFILNKESILNQVNFNLELENTQYFKVKYQNSTNIIIPNVYYDYSNEKVIIMDYIDNINENIENLTIEESNIYLKLILQFYYNNAIFKKLLHCDLHLGNVLFIKELNNENKIEYKLGIIDYGICLKLDTKEQNCVGRLFLKLVNDAYGLTFYNILSELFIHLKDKYNIILNTETVLDEMEERNNEDKNKMLLSHYDIYSINKILKRHKIILPGRTYNILLGFVSLLGNINKFLSKFKSIEEKEKFYKTIFKNIL